MLQGLIPLTVFSHKTKLLHNTVMIISDVTQECKPCIEKGLLNIHKQFVSNKVQFYS